MHHRMQWRPCTAAVPHGGDIAPAAAHVVAHPGLTRRSAVLSGVAAVAVLLQTHPVTAAAVAAVDGEIADLEVGLTTAQGPGSFIHGPDASDN